MVARLRPERFDAQPMAVDADVANRVGYHDDEDEVPDSTLAQPQAQPHCVVNVRTEGADSTEHAHLFFTVLSPTPRLTKGIAYGSGVCEGFHADELSISLQTASWVNGELRVADWSVGMVQGGCSSQVVFALPHCTREQLLRSVYEWDVVDRQVVIEGLPPSIPGTSAA